MGIESIRILLNIKAPLLILLGLGAVGLGLFPSRRIRRNAFAPFAVRRRAAARRKVLGLLRSRAHRQRQLLGHAGAEHSRLQPLRPQSQRDQVLGQALGLADDDGPVFVHRRGGHLGGVCDLCRICRRTQKQESLGSRFSALAVCQQSGAGVRDGVRWRLATLATNIAANVVSPANDFAHLWPRMISFRIGGLITGIIGILIQPWRLLANASVYIDKWLIGYSLAAGRGRRRADCRLFRHPPHAARSGRPVSKERPLLVLRRIQSAGHHRAAVRHRLVRPGIPGGRRQSRSPCKATHPTAPHSSDPHSPISGARPLQLRLVHQLRRLRSCMYVVLMLLFGATITDPMAAA